MKIKIGTEFSGVGSAGISDSQLYKQTGNSIVVRCLELIIGILKL